MLYEAYVVTKNGNYKSVAVAGENKAEARNNVKGLPFVSDRPDSILYMVRIGEDRYLELMDDIYFDYYGGFDDAA